MRLSTTCPASMFLNMAGRRSNQTDRLTVRIQDAVAVSLAGKVRVNSICIDSGMTRQMIYHGDNGWKLEL